MEKREPSSTAVCVLNCCSHYENSVEVPQKIKKSFFFFFPLSWALTGCAPLSSLPPSSRLAVAMGFGDLKSPAGLQVLNEY